MKQRLKKRWNRWKGNNSLKKLLQLLLGSVRLGHQRETPEVLPAFVSVFIFRFMRLYWLITDNTYRWLLQAKPFSKPFTWINDSVSHPHEVSGIIIHPTFRMRKPTCRQVEGLTTQHIASRLWSWNLSLTSRPNFLSTTLYQ